MTMRAAVVCERCGTAIGQARDETPRDLVVGRRTRLGEHPAIRELDEHLPDLRYGAPNRKGSP